MRRSRQGSGLSESNKTIIASATARPSGLRVWAPNPCTMVFYMALSFLIRLHSVCHRILIYKKKTTLKKELTVAFRSPNGGSPWPPRSPSFLPKASSISMPSSFVFICRENLIGYCLADKHTECFQIQVLTRIFVVWFLPFRYLLIFCHCSLCDSHSSNATLPLIPCGQEAFHSPASRPMLLPVSRPCLPPASTYLGAPDHHSNPNCASVF